MFSVLFNRLINTFWEGKATQDRDRQYIDYSQETDHNYRQTERQRQVGHLGATPQIGTPSLRKNMGHTQHIVIILSLPTAVLPHDALE